MKTTQNTDKNELPSFHFAFQISKMVVLEVHYYRCGNNDSKHFSTEAEQFNRPKTDYNHCGQAQDELLNGAHTAMSFYKKFDPLHLKDLTSAEHAEILAAIEKLKARYNYIQADYEPSFSQIRALSMDMLKTLQTA
jgi:hypothetical protein